MGFFSSFKKEGSFSEKKLPPPLPPLSQEGIINQKDLPIPPPPQFNPPQFNESINKNNSSITQAPTFNTSENKNLSSPIPQPPTFNTSVDKNLSFAISQPPLFNAQIEKETKTNNNIEVSSSEQNNNFSFQLPETKNLILKNTQQNQNLQNQNLSLETKKIQDNMKEDERKKINAPNALPILPPLKLHELKSFESNTIENKELDSFEIEEIPSFSIKEEEINFEPKDKLPLIDIFDIEEPALNFRYGISNKGLFEKKPLFIRTDHYSSVLTTIDSVKEYVTNSPVIIYNLENLKKNIDIENKKLKECIEDMQRKIIYVDKVLFERDTNG